MNTTLGCVRLYAEWHYEIVSLGMLGMLVKLVSDITSLMTVPREIQFRPVRPTYYPMRKIAQ